MFDAPSGAPSGAVISKPTLASRLGMWLHSHQLDAQRSLRDLLGAPISTLFTLLVIAVALALPMSLQVLLRNGATVAGSWDDAARVTLYLNASVSDDSGQALAKRLLSEGDVSEARFHSAADNLDRFRTQSGLGAALDYLDGNPLPATVEVLPAAHYQTPVEAEQLLTRLRALPEVESATLDLEWLRRLHALLRIAGRVAEGLGLLLAAAVVLIVSNTIRLTIENRRSEIEVIKLVGATDAFIRRPFLYLGLWFGMGGALLASLLVSLLLLSLATPVAELAGLYDSQFRLAGLRAGDVAALLLFGVLLGLVGAMLSVNRHLRAIQPR